MRTLAQNMPVRFNDHEIKSGLRSRRLLSAYLEGQAAVYRPQLKKVNLNYVFCTDNYLLSINQQFLNHDTLTDIITFDLGEPEEHNQITGEIYISVDRVRENAVKFGVTAEDELHRVIFHGMLHLCGFKDKKKQDSAIMRAKEEECLTGYKKFESEHALRDTI